MDDTEKFRKCKCGGDFRVNIEKLGLEHTYPTCKMYQDLDIEAELAKGYGHFGLYLYNMEKRAEA